MDRIDAYIDNLMVRNSDVLDREQIKKIDGDIHTYQNSINL
jgi:hypothetical protein